MKMANKLAKILAVLSLILCLALLFGACNTAKEDGKNDGDSQQTTGPDSDTDPDDDGDQSGEDKPDPDEGKVTYTVNVKDLDGNGVAGVEVQFCIGEICNAPILSNENGVASALLEEGAYHVKINPGVYAAEPSEYEFEEGSTTLEVTVYKLPTGTADDPIPVTENETQIKLKAGAKLYYTIYFPADKIVTIENEKAVVEYNGVTYTAQNGKVEIRLEDGMMASLAVSSSDGKLALFNMKVSIAPGTMGNPHTLESIDSMTVSVPANGEVFYTWTATMNGVFTVFCNNTENDITLANTTSFSYPDPSNGAGSVSVNVSKGDTVTICFSTIMNENDFTSPAAELQITFQLLT